MSQNTGLKYGFIVILAAAIAACGGGAGSNATPPPPSSTQSAPLLSKASFLQATSAACPTGGAQIDSGFDANANGVLDASEITSTQYVCNGVNGANGTNGTNGANGLNALVSTSAEPAGANCANAGYKIDAGTDTNSNGALEATEVTSTKYVCNGANAAAGAQGAAGFNSLMVIALEPRSANCAYGGSKITSGLDSNRNNMLDASEVTSTNYLCYGPPLGINWVRTTVDVPAALSNTGYFTDSAAQLAITLPPAPVAGDVLAVNGVGAGGWKIAQNAGQSIYLKNAAPTAISWIPRYTAKDWTAVASSADGSKLIAAPFAGPLYTSGDSGVTWTVTSSLSTLWSAVASSADGAKLVAVGGTAAVPRLITSSDSGLTWTAAVPPASSTTFGNLKSAASSADGNKLIVAANGGFIFTSGDAGATWTQRDQSRNWVAVASSASGDKLVATDGLGIFTSTDSGVTWTARSTQYSWTSLASSADGAYLFAAHLTGLQISADSGVTWLPSGPSIPLYGIKSSADGLRLFATSGNRATSGMLYLSDDGGKTWAGRDSARTWTGIAASSDGSRLLACTSTTSGQLYTAETRTTIGVTGYVAGGQFDALELQYLGNGQWDVLSHVGSLTYF